MKIYICKKVKNRNYKIIYLQKYDFSQIQESIEAEEHENKRYQKLQSRNLDQANGIPQLQFLKRPVLYLSDFFEKNRRDYYDNLMRVREKNDIYSWIRFFLIGVIETAEASIRTFQQILELREKVEFTQLIELGKRQQDAKKVLNYLYRNPIIDGAKVAEILDVHASTANRLINDLVQLGILEELTGFKRNRIFAFQAYIDLFSTP